MSSSPPSGKSQSAKPSWTNRFGTWILSAIGIVIVGAIAAFVTPFGKDLHDVFNPAKPELSIVDVAFDEGHGMYDSEMTIHVENTGNQTAYLTRAYLDVNRIWVLAPGITGFPRVGGHEGISFRYTYTLPRRPSSSQYVALSQIVKPGDTDNFGIVLLPLHTFFGRPSRLIHVYLAHLKLLYNTHAVTSPALLFAATTGDDLSHNLTLGGSRSIVEQNKAALRGIDKASNGAIRGVALDEVLSQLKNG